MNSNDAEILLKKANPVADEREHYFCGPIGFRNEEEIARTLSNMAAEDKRRAERAMDKAKAYQNADRHGLATYEMLEIAAAISYQLHRIRQAPGVADVRNHLLASRELLLERAGVAKAETYNGTPIRLEREKNEDE